MGNNISFPVPRERLLEIDSTSYNISLDKTLLFNLGVNAAYLAAFQTEITEAESFKTDGAMTKELEAVTKIKDAKRAEAYKWVEQAKFFINKTFPKKSPQRNEIPPDYSKWQKNESLLIFNMLTVIALLTKYNGELTAQNMPSDFTAKGQPLIDALKAANYSQEQMKEDNKNFTFLRHVALIKLYNRINKINWAGRMAYADDSVTLQYFETPCPKNKKSQAPPPYIKIIRSMADETYMEGLKQQSRQRRDYCKCFHNGMK